MARTELSIIYEPAEAGWVTASIPAVPGTISAGSTRAKARSNVLDALAEMLSVEPDEVPRGADVERVELALALDRDAARDVDLEL